ncbi:MAG: ribbon-helix-helix domain-containing protein, partial [Candidatus Thermoplasmatota archaeon]|nr:ribbon-helix-helix domain-containing protein [Candidatus Thermoplasmatota archaeon]MBU1941483.1 ribbon-helix-helix domain-containing protein [Candidatus Thermoplasmatota archaeon]
MNKTKGIAIRLDDELYNRIEQQNLPRSELIRTAIEHFLAQTSLQQTAQDNDIADDLYQDIYNTLYNTEVQPLKEELQYHQRIVTLLERQLKELQQDKQFLQNQLHAQTVLTATKNPWFQNIKT